MGKALPESHLGLPTKRGLGLGDVRPDHRNQFDGDDETCHDRYTYGGGEHEGFNKSWDIHYWHHSMVMILNSSHLRLPGSSDVFSLNTISASGLTTSLTRLACDEIRTAIFSYGEINH